MPGDQTKEILESLGICASEIGRLREAGTVA
jgi:hypothetical protein